MESIWPRLLLISPVILVIEVFGSLAAIATVPSSVVARAAFSTSVRMQLNPSAPLSETPEVAQRFAEASIPEQAVATPLEDATPEDEVPMAQVTSVSQLGDVKPTDWAFQALQSLVERYGCIVGYPDKTYRGNRALTRYEFAAGLNACMDRINELIAAGTANLVKKEDLLAVQRLQEEFAAELATLRGRVDALEA